MLYRIQRQPEGADIFADPWETVVTVASEPASDRLWAFMIHTWPEYQWAIQYDRI